MTLLGYVVDRSASDDQGYYAIRGREQIGINAHGGVGSPNVGNSLSGIFILNPRLEVYLKQAYRSLMIGASGE